MSWREFLHWQAYLELEPPDRGDTQRFAALMAQITNMSGRSLPDRKMVKASDFLPKKAQTPQQQKAFFQSLTEQLNGG